MNVNFKNTMKISLVISYLTLLGCSVNPNGAESTADKQQDQLDFGESYHQERSLNNFNDYVEFLKNKAAQQGVSSKTLHNEKNINYIAKAVALDHQQAGKAKKHDPNLPPPINSNGVTNYLNRVLTQNKVNVALDRYWEILTPLQQASEKYAVQKEYLIALWGMESSFGYYQGNYDVLSVLATLAFDGRRENLFGKEFINALKMLERDHIDRRRMLGSWAGAMGQTQFMPSSYLNYAADGDNDGEKNIWNNQYDVFASIANYLHTVGWNDKLPWGIEVTLAHPLELSLAGIEMHKKRALDEWTAQGISLKLQTPQEQQKLTALSHAELWLIRPDKEEGRAFLVTNNFRTIMDWNKSTYFAVSIGMFADRIKQGLGL